HPPPHAPPPLAARRGGAPGGQGNRPEKRPFGECLKGQTSYNQRESNGEKGRLTPRFWGSSVDLSTARYRTADTATGAGCRARAGSCADGRRIIHQRPERFAHSKPRDLFRWNLHQGARFRVAAYTRRPATEPEAAKSPQFHFVPGPKGIDDTLPEQRDHGFGLVLRELKSGGDFVHELSLLHNRITPAGGGQRPVLDAGKEE